MVTQSYNQLVAGANKIKSNELPESNTAVLVGEQMLQMVNKQSEEHIERVAAIKAEQEARLLSTTEYDVSAHHPTAGIGGTNKFTLAEAIKLIPQVLRRVGIKCSFLDGAEKVACYEYQGGAWEDVKSWVKVDGAVVTDMLSTQGTLQAEQQQHGDKLANLEQGQTTHTNDIASLRTSISAVATQEITTERLSAATKQYIESAGGGTITNNADDEDLEVVQQNGLSVLKLKDKVHDAAAFSGKGRKILRKNIVQGKNILTQEMINKPNTIYIVQYDFDLQGQKINVPNSCVLKFEDGSFSNGSIHANNTYLKAGKFVFKNIRLSGTFLNNEMKLSWFVVDQNNASDIIQNLIDNFSKIFLDISTVKINKPINIRSYKRIYGPTNIGVADSFSPVKVESETISTAFYYEGSLMNTTISDINFYANYKLDFAITATNSLINKAYFINGIIRNCQFRSVTKIAVRMHGIEQGELDSLYIQDCGCGIYINVKELDYNNILNLDFGANINMPNLVKIRNSRIMLCNYGLIANFGSDLTMNNCECAHNACYDIYVAGGQSFSITDFYSEGSGSSCRWVDRNGITGGLNQKVMVPQLSNEHIGEGNARLVGWGIEDTNRKGRFIRPIIYTKACNNYFHNLFLSYYQVRNSIDDVIPDYSQNTKVGIDTFFCLFGSSNLSAINVYDNSKIGKRPKTILYSVLNSTSTICLDDIPWYYYGNALKECVYLSAKTNSFIYKSLPLRIDVKSKILESVQYQDIYNSCYEEDYKLKGSVLKMCAKEIYEKNGMYLFKAKQRNKGFIIPKSYFNGYCYYFMFLVYNKNKVTSEFYLRAYGIAGELKTLINENTVSFKTEFTECVSFLNKEDIDRYEYIAIEVNSFNNTNIWTSVPIFVNPFTENSLEIKQDLFPKSGTTSDRPSPVQVGYVYKDTDLKKWIIWNGTEWENLDGTSL